MTVDVRYFGSVADVTNCTNENVELDEDLNVGDLDKFLKNKYPGLKKIDYKLTCNKQFTNEGDSLKDGSEIALLPPFAGG